MEGLFAYGRHLDSKDMCLGLLERKVISGIVEPKLRGIITRFGEDVYVVRGMFAKDKEDPPCNKNSPPYAGAVAWVR